MRRRLLYTVANAENTPETETLLTGSFQLLVTSIFAILGSAAQQKVQSPC